MANLFNILDQTAFVPIGTIDVFAKSTVPTANWLACDGSAVSRTTYAALFAIIGTTFGVGDGSTTFNLPDLRGKSPIGAGTLAFAASQGGDTVSDAPSTTLTGISVIGASVAAGSTHTHRAAGLGVLFMIRAL